MDAVRRSESSEREYPDLGRNVAEESEIVRESESESRYQTSKGQRKPAVKTDALGELDKEAIAKRLNVDPKLGIGVGMSEEAFRKHVAEVGLPPELCEKLISDVHGFVSLLKELSEEEKASIDEKNQFAESVKKLPADRSVCRQFSTTLPAGALAYLTSFFFGKLAMNLLTIPTKSPDGAWAFLAAGLLNPLVTEPLVKGVRASGAAYASPDGNAYTEYHTAKLWMENASQHPDECIRWRKKMAEVVTDVLCRERKYGIQKLGSGVADIVYSDEGQPVSAKAIDGKPMKPTQAEEQVIVWARRRAYITDELPFFFFTLNYTVSGALAPFFKASFSPWTFCAIDLALSATLGTLSGMETATLQNVLRRYIQGAKLMAETPELKRAQQSAAYAKRAVYEEKMARLKQVRAVLIAQWETLRMKEKNGEDVREQLHGVRQSLREAKKAYRSVRGQYMAIKRKFNQHNSVTGRVAQAVQSSMSSYIDEAGLRPNSASGKNYRLKAYSKLIGYPLSLVPQIVWSSYAMPWIVSVVYPNHGAVDPLNISGISGFNATTVDLAPEPARVESVPSEGDPRLQLQMILAALSGIPLIVGFTMRQQVLSRGAEWLLVKAFGDKPVAPQKNADDAQIGDEDSIVEASEDDSTIVSRWSGSDSDPDSDFESTRREPSDDSSDEDTDAPSRMERGRHALNRDKVTRVDGMLSDDDAYSTADDAEEHSTRPEANTSIEV